MLFQLRIGFEEIVFHIERDDLLDILEHPNRVRYHGQRIFVVRREGDDYLVPFVEDEHTVRKTGRPANERAISCDLRERSGSAFLGDSC